MLSHLHVHDLSISQDKLKLNYGILATVDKFAFYTIESYGLGMC